MTEHSCIHETEFGRMITMLDQHDKVLNGNGQKGLRDIVTELNLTVKELKPVIDDLRTAVSGFGKFQIETEVDIRANEKQKSNIQLKRVNTQWIITTIIVLILFILEKILE